MSGHGPQIRDEASRYLRAGLSVLPAWRRGIEKSVALKLWGAYQDRLPTQLEVDAWFANGHTALCLVGGAISGNLEAIDFDAGGEMFGAWHTLVHETAPDLLDRVVIESTPSGGKHVVYRCQSPVCGSFKIAQRKVIVPSADPVAILGKTLVPRKDADGNWFVIVLLIETRGEGGVFLCAPSDGYSLIQGDFTNLPVLTTEERDVLLEAAWTLNEHFPEPVVCSKRSSIPTAPGELRPGDDFNQRGDIPALLLKHGWTLARDAENQYWRRPGKSVGWSATLKGRVFYNFSKQANPFEDDKAYSPFTVYALLEHNGDYAAAAGALRAQGYGSTPTDVDLSAITNVATRPESPPDPTNPDPGPTPDELLTAPGFIREVMDYTLHTAPYPNLAMAFAGALALQAFLAGRKVRDPGDNRTNLYLLGLAHSASGKDWPRKVNTRIAHAVGLASRVGDRFASGEGIQDALLATPCMLFQTDEIDGMLQGITKSKDARHESIMGTLLTMYSAANSVFPMRRKAGADPDLSGLIDQPCLVLFGTAIPNHYFEALSERMLTNGFFARMLVFESAPRGTGREPRVTPLPERIRSASKWWAEFQPGGDLHTEFPVPAIVEQTSGAQHLLIESRERAEAEYAKAEASRDAVGTTVWGRVSEQTRKLALIYAISENHNEPMINADAVRWASALVMHQTRRMLFMAQGHTAENPFHGDCLRLINKLREAPGNSLAHSVLLKRMKMDARRFAELIDTLIQSGDVEAAVVPSDGRHGRTYRLLG